MTAITEQSFKKHLQNIAKERNVTPAELWQNVILERFLVRLCKSAYQSNFILKGGILLAKHVNIGRETKDLDFAVEALQKDADSLTKIFEEIAAIQIEDGFEFKNVKLELLSPYHMQYPGAQMRIEACFGSTRASLFIDLGFGDRVDVKEQDIQLAGNAKGSLFEKSIPLKCYPVAFIFAEKIETVVFRGGNNSRMKDFHDLFTMIHTENVLDKKETLDAMRVVFEHRRTPMNIPLQFDEADAALLQKQWQRYRPSLAQPKTLPQNIQEVIDSINTWLKMD